MDEGTKKCPQCQVTKSVCEFGRNASLSDGLAFYCKECCRLKAKEHYRRKRAEMGKEVRARDPRLEGYKWCPDCRDLRRVKEFPRNRASADGLNSYCKTHHNARGQSTHLARKYGLTTNKVKVMAERQAGICVICLRPLKRAHVDHDHATGEIRGLLCFNCNGGLGQFRDNPMALRRAAEYLEGTLRSPARVAPGIYDVSSLAWRPGS